MKAWAFFGTTRLPHMFWMFGCNCVCRILETRASHEVKISSTSTFTFIFYFKGVHDKNVYVQLKWQFHEIFWENLFCLKGSTWAPNEQTKTVSQPFSFWRRYSNCKFEKFDSAQCLLTKHFGLHWNISHIFLNKFNFRYQGKERSAKTKLMPGKLRAVLACAESLISRISPRKRIFQLNHFSQFIRGPSWFDSWNKKCQKQKISWHCHF